MPVINTVMCNSRDFRQGMGGGILSDIVFVYKTAQVWPDSSKLSETLTVFLIFFYINKGAYKTGGAQAGRGICCSNVSKANFS